MGLSVQINSFVAVCPSCKGEREVRFDSPLISARELAWWLKNRLEPCSCGATVANVKLPLPHGVEP